MELKMFQKMINKLNRDKFHICISLNDYKDLTNFDWIIFRKDMPLEEYFSPENKPVLDSKNNTIEELLEFLKSEGEINE